MLRGLNLEFLEGLVLQCVTSAGKYYRESGPQRSYSFLLPQRLPEYSDYLS